nr:dehydrogenase E1 component [Actinoallomurus sp.]
MTGVLTGRPALSLTEPSADDLDLMLLIRHFELALLDLFARGELNGTTHTCVGQEYVPVALGTLLTDQDHIFSNHRGHGHYLARFRDPAGLLAEIMGREGAVCSGVGGSQHILRDRFMSTGVQGESLPLAAGTALHLRDDPDGPIALAYVGEGTWGEGGVYEALNLAALWGLPLVVVVENNGISQSTPTEHNLAGTIAGRAAGFGIRHEHVTDIDVNAIRARLRPAFEEVRRNRAPLVVEFRTYRLGPHSKGDDTRSEEELTALRAYDWYRAYRESIPDRFEAADGDQRDRIERLVADVMRRPASTWEPGPSEPSEQAWSGTSVWHSA